MKEQILKENKGLSGIYWWVNNVNGKTYIDSAVDISKRLNEHLNGLRTNLKLKQSFIKYGLRDSLIGFLEYCDKSLLLQWKGTILHWFS